MTSISGQEGIGMHPRDSTPPSAKSANMIASDTWVYDVTNLLEQTNAYPQTLSPIHECLGSDCEIIMPGLECSDREFG